jgi:subtilisin family serine protease
MLSTANERNINIIAAGLENQAQPGFPADLPYVIPVISAGPDGKTAQPAWLKNYSGTVAAPGVEVLTTVPNEGYDFVSGSSLATAHISGIIALILELKPRLTPQIIKNLLIHKGVEGAAPKPMTVDACVILGQIGEGGGC